MSSATKSHFISVEQPLHQRCKPCHQRRKAMASASNAMSSTSKAMSSATESHVISVKRTGENDIDYFNKWCPAIVQARDLFEVPDSLIKKTTPEDKGFVLPGEVAKFQFDNHGRS
jgi:hypothetical protein